MSELFDRTGPMAIATRLRLLSERMTKESEKIFHFYGVDIKPKWYPVFYSLSQEPFSKSITTIAKEIGQSHPSVIKIVKEMAKAGLVTETKDKHDGRKNNISFSPKGKEYAKRIEEQYLDTSTIVEEMLQQTKHNLWFALEEFEHLLDESSTYPRVIEAREKRVAKKVTIIPYEPTYQEAFKNLNAQWITQYFTMEEKDEQILNDPQTSILSCGGHILMAVYEGKPVGTCTLIKINKEKYELSKMAVTSDFQGKGIGKLLGEAIIEQAKALHVKTLYIETNTILRPAISLYQKLGFKKILSSTSTYTRSNLQMELTL